MSKGIPLFLALAVVGLLESLLTASIVDDMTETESDKNKESRGHGIANMVAGVFLIFLIIVLGGLVVHIPMAALVGVMIMVAIGTFDWSSLRSLTVMPRTDATVLVVTVATVVITHNLDKGVYAGILLSAIFFVAKISKVHVRSVLEDKSAEKAIFLAQNIPDAKITVIYVVDGSTSKKDALYHYDQQGIATQRQEKMVTTEEKAKAAGVHYETKVIRGEPGPSIVKYANENNYDLIIVGSRGLNALQEMVLGSVSHKVAKRANCSVMIVK